VKELKIITLIMFVSNLLYPYTISPGDVIKISLKEKEREFNVLPDGNIYLPGFGELKLSGKTLKEAEEYLKRVYHPEVDIISIKPTEESVIILGDKEVIKPGKYPQGTIAEIIALSGGISEKAEGLIYIYQDGEWREFELSDIFENRIDYQLQYGDMIYIPYKSSARTIKEIEENIKLFKYIIYPILTYIAIKKGLR